MPAHRSGRGLYRPRPYNRPAHLIHMVFTLTSVVALSVIAVFYALGYEINWTTYTVRQTGIISLIGSSVQPGDDIQVSLNGKEAAERLPIRLTHIFPGQYDIAVTKDGYQKWLRTVRVDPNQAVTFRSLILVRDNAQPVTIPIASFQEDQAGQLNQSGIQVSENELYLNDKFITRTSQDILNASWFPDGQHMVYQAGDAIWLSDLDGLNSQLLVRLPEVLPAEYYFTDGGRTFYYRTGTDVAYRLSIL